MSHCQQITIIIQTIHRVLPSRFFSSHFNMNSIFNVRSNKKNKEMFDRLYYIKSFRLVFRKPIVRTVDSCPAIVNNYEVKCWPITNSFECNIVVDVLASARERRTVSAAIQKYCRWRCDISIHTFAMVCYHWWWQSN